jgi:transposase
VLTREEQTTLEGWVRRRSTAQAITQRARIVLRAAVGDSNTVIACGERVTRATVGKWRARFVRQRLDGLRDGSRPGAPRKITDAEVEAVITRTLGSAPPDAARWSTRSMAKACGLSQSAVSRIWRAAGLQPTRRETVSVGESARPAARNIGVTFD